MKNPEQYHRFYVGVNWIARKSGGLFLGVRVQFPTSDTNLIDMWRSTWITIGFLFFQVRIEINGKKTPLSIPVFYKRETK